MPSSPPLLQTIRASTTTPSGPTDPTELSVPSELPEETTVSAATDPKSPHLLALLEAYLLLVDSPTDEQVHSLSRAIGLDPETLEAVLYEMFGDLLRSEEEESPDVALLGDELDAGLLDSDDLFDEDLDSDLDLDQLALEGSDEIGRLADNDGAPDEEQLGIPDQLKEAMDTDGEVDEELFLEPAHPTS